MECEWRKKAWGVGCGAYDGGDGEGHGTAREGCFKGAQQRGSGTCR